MKVKRKAELTVVGKMFLVLNSILVIIGFSIKNYLFIIPGLINFIIITASLLGYFSFEKIPEIQLSLSKDFIRNRSFLAVALTIRNTSNKIVSYKIKLNFTYHLIIIDSADTKVIKLRPMEEKKIGWYLLAIRRGNANVGPIEVSLGLFQQLFKNTLTYEHSLDIKVLPHKPKVFIPWKTKKDLLMQLVNQFAQRVKGQGTEFYGLRDYLPGDEMKHIDWRATAKHDKLITREYEDEKQLHFLIFLDLGSTMFGPKFDYALSSVVELCTLIRGTNHDLAVIAYSNIVERFVVPQVGIQELKLMLNLYDLEAIGVQSNFIEAVKFVKTQNLHHSIAIIFSDLDGDLTKKLEGINTLKAMGSRIIFVNFSTTAFNLLASKETLSADAPNMFYKELLEHVFPSLVKDEYKKRELKVRNLLRPVEGDIIEVNGYYDNVIFALYRLMKKYSPRQRIILEAKVR